MDRRPNAGTHMISRLPFKLLVLGSKGLAMQVSS